MISYTVVDAFYSYLVDVFTMNDASVSISLTAWSWKCLSAMAARIAWISAVSAKMGVRLSLSSSNRELRRRLGSFVSLLGLFPEVEIVNGLRPRGFSRTGSRRESGEGGSAAVKGDGYTGGMRLK
jgi:hypothetical protein